MSFEIIDTPVPGPGAFESTTDAGLLSQAGILLAVGAGIRGKDTLILADEDRSALSIPPTLFRTLEAKETYLNPDVVRNTMTRQLGERNFPSDLSQPIQGRTLAEIFDAMTEKPDPLWTAGLLEACLRHPKEIVRVASAAAYSTSTTEKDRIVDILVEGTHSSDVLVQDLAATALVEAAPGHARLNTLSLRTRRTGAGGESHTTLLVHGTFARQQTWWQPRGDFHAYLTTSLPNLLRDPPWSAPYAAGDRFDWTGGYSDIARNDAAQQLLQWVNAHGALGLDLITHSHGGNIVLLATNLGLNIGELVLLSCPPIPNKYWPNFAGVRGPIVSFRVRMDLVLLADSFVSGAQTRFADPHIQEHVLPIWFDHSLTHDALVWDSPKYNIRQSI